MAENATNLWTALGTIVGFLTLVCTVYSLAANPRRKKSDCALFFCDSGGVPKTDVFLLFADGFRVEPNTDGMVTLPSHRGGQAASVRDAKTRREIRVIVTPERLREVCRIHL